MLKEHIDAALKQAMKDGDALRRSVFRMLSAAIHNREIEKRSSSGEAKDMVLGDGEIIPVIRSELKKRRDAAEAYDRAGRTEASAGERAEGEILAALLPAELSDEEIARLAADGKAALGAASPQDFGKLMGWVMQRVGGRASGERVSAAIKRELGT
ncbi:MAG: GatB/YqeY domain-containing protein [bacterium]|nr:GatB/YqeY domain-containing protein [bacterium]